MRKKIKVALSVIVLSVICNCFANNNLIEGQMLKNTTENLTINKTNITLNKGNYGRLISYSPVKAGDTYKFKFVFKNTSTKFFYKNPIGLRITFKNSTEKNKMIKAQLSKKLFKPNATLSIEETFVAPKGATRANITIFLRLDKVEVIDYELVKLEK